MTWYDEMLKQREEGSREVQYKIALKMLKKHTPIKQVAEITELSLAELEKLAKENRLATI